MTFSKSLKLIIAISLLTGCGPKAPLVTDCVITPTNLTCSNGKIAVSPKNQGLKYYTQTPVQSNAYICMSPGDFENSKIYVQTLQTRLVKCDMTAVVKPKVTLCAIDGNHMILYCSDGIKVTQLQWMSAVTYLCVSPSDYDLLTIYKNGLIQDLANCKVVI